MRAKGDDGAVKRQQSSEILSRALQKQRTSLLRGNDNDKSTPWVHFKNSAIGKFGLLNVREKKVLFFVCLYVCFVGSEANVC